MAALAFDLLRDQATLIELQSLETHRNTDLNDNRVAGKLVEMILTKYNSQEVHNECLRLKKLASWFNDRHELGQTAVTFKGLPATLSRRESIPDNMLTNGNIPLYDQLLGAAIAAYQDTVRWYDLLWADQLKTLITKGDATSDGAAIDQLRKDWRARHALLVQSSIPVEKPWASVQDPSHLYTVWGRKPNEGETCWRLALGIDPRFGLPSPRLDRAAEAIQRLLLRHDPVPEPAAETTAPAEDPTEASVTATEAFIAMALTRLEELKKA